MRKGKPRALVLVPGFGGGKYLLETLVKNEDEQEEFRKIFTGGIISPDVGNRAKEGAVERSERIIQSIKQLSDNSRITISTFSGGGFVVRCLMSLLRSDHPKIFERIELITVEDGAILGAYIPPAYLIAQVLGEKGDMCKRNLPLPGLNKNLSGKLAREIAVCWPLDVDSHRHRDMWSGVAEMGNNPDREYLLTKLEALDKNRHWGEGAYTAAYTNGGIEPFDHGATDRDLVHYLGEIVFEDYSLEIVFNVLRLEIDTSDLACLKGSKIQKLAVEFTDKTGAWAMAPGCYHEENTGADRAKKTSEAIENAAKSHRFSTQICEYSREQVAYIHTTSSLDIEGDPFGAMFGEDYLRENSRFDEFHFRNENQQHCFSWYRQDNLNRIKEGPPS